MFPNKNGLKQGYVLSLTLFDLALEYSIKRVQAKPGRLEIE